MTVTVVAGGKDGSSCARVAIGSAASMKRMSWTIDWLGMIKSVCDEYGNNATYVANGQAVNSDALRSGSSLSFGHGPSFGDEKNLCEIVEDCYNCNLVCCVSINDTAAAVLTDEVVSE